MIWFLGNTGERFAINMINIRRRSIPSILWLPCLPSLEWGIAGVVGQARIVWIAVVTEEGVRG